MRVCAPLPGKPYFSVDGRKLFTRKSPRRRCEFAPHTRESLISPSRGANPSPGNPPRASASLRPSAGKALFFRRGAQTFHPEEPPAAAGVCASFPGKPYFSVERRKPFCPEEPPAAAGVCAPYPGKPCSTVEGRKPFAGKNRRWRRGFAPPSRESLISPSRGANFLQGKAPAAVRVCAPLPGKPVMK